MSNPPNEEPPSPDGQVTYLNDTLKLVKEMLEGPVWSQEIYDQATNLLTETRGTILAIYANPASTSKHHRQAQSALKESSQAQTAANKRHRKFAIALQKQQQARRGKW